GAPAVPGGIYGPFFLSVCISEKCSISQCGGEEATPELGRK
ncbi:hypothetical protein pipiens_016700, partial [Culex pipiens pipiens]